MTTHASAAAFPDQKYVGRVGDLEVSLVSATIERDRNPESCMLLRQINRPTEFLVPLSTGWMWLEEEHMVAMAAAAAQKLYPFMTRDDVHRVIDAVLLFMEDLHRHPPPKGENQTLDSFLEACERDGLEFFVEVNGDRKVLN